MPFSCLNAYKIIFLQFIISKTAAPTTEYATSNNRAFVTTTPTCNLLQYQKSNVQVLCTDSFSVHCGVRQGDPLSPAIFNINDLVDNINSLNMGIEFNKLKICILLYANDIVLLSPTPVALQCMLFYLDLWYKLWHLSKCNVLHFGNLRKPRTIHLSLH